MTTIDSSPAPVTGATTRPTPLVSVVIPCYAQAHFLGEAIESVRAQAPVRVDVVVVDDGSPDDVASVVARYPGVRYIRQSNQGLSGARNTGLHASRGDYVVFLDSDDRLVPGALAAGLDSFAEHPEAALVFGEFRFMAEDGTPLSQRVRHKFDGDLYGALLLRNHVEMLSTVLFRRDVVERSGGFLTSLRAAEDYDLLLRIARTWPAYAHSTLVAEYRRHGTSMSHDPARMLRNTMIVLHKQWPHVRGTPQYESALRHGIRFFQNYYGGELIDQVRTLTHEGAWRRAFRGSLTALRYYPRGIALRVMNRARHVFDPANG